MGYEFTANSIPFNIISAPIISLDEFQQLQQQAEQIELSTLVRSYISSIIIALRLHPKVVSTSISPRAVEDARNLVRVSTLRGGKRGTWTNAEGVSKAIELCTSFRLRIVEEVDGVTYKEILKEVLENTRAPF